MAAIELSWRDRWEPAASLALRLAVPVLIFGLVFSGYYILQGYLNAFLLEGRLSYKEPLDWYQHHVYLAQAILNGNFDVGAAGIPESYHDTIVDGASQYVTFPPGPSVLLLPFVAIWGTDFSQIYFSMFLGAVNAVLF